MGKLLGAACAAIALLCAPAPAACWREGEAAAAQVRELQTLLMVATLRCEISRHGIAPDYNAFLRANRATIEALNDRLKTHFIAAAGPVAGQTAYDGYTTMLANGHGGDDAGAAVCGGMAALAREAAMMGGSAEGLQLLAARQGLRVALPEGACPPPAPATGIVMATAPASSVIVAAPAASVVVAAATPVAAGVVRTDAVAVPRLIAAAPAVAPILLLAIAPPAAPVVPAAQAPAATPQQSVPPRLTVALLAP